MDNHRKRKTRRDGSVTAVAGSAAATGQSLLHLFDSELSLTGQALLRAALMALIGVALAGVGGLLLAGLMVVLLQATGLSWLVSLSIVTLVTLIALVIALYRARSLLELCGLPATRRQLGRIFGESTGKPEPPA